MNCEEFDAKNNFQIWTTFVFLVISQIQSRGREFGGNYLLA